MKILVVGGVAGGATAIARLRRLDEHAEIILIERGKYVSFANCGLPYYVGGVIQNRDSLFVATAEGIKAKYGVEVRTEHEVKSIDREAKTCEILDLSTGSTYTESYDKLLLSTGSKPFVPPIKGVDAPTVFTLWTVADVDKISEYIAKNSPKKAVVVGGGFIGLEMAENLVEKGIAVTLVEMANQVMPPIDEDMARIVENHLAEKGVKLMLGKGFSEVRNDGRTVVLDSGEEIETDMVLLSIGVRPNNELAKSAGLKLTDRGGVLVSEYMQTSDPSIYAVGDVVGVNDFVLGGATMIPLAGPANKQGRAVSANVLGKSAEKYVGTMGTSVAKVFDMTVAAVGANEKSLSRAGFAYRRDYHIALVHPMSSAGYYPGAGSMTIKLIFDKNGKILGSQIVGYDGVDKRIDVIAAAVHFGGSVSDLAEFELAYAPPYNTAKDPVNFAGFVAENILSGLTDPVLYREYAADKSVYTLVDVREAVECESFAVEGAVNIPLSEIRNRIGEFDKSKHYLVFCAVGVRGYIAERILKQNGITVSNMAGGLRTMCDSGEELRRAGRTWSAVDKFIRTEGHDPADIGAGAVPETNAGGVSASVYVSASASACNAASEPRSDSVRSIALNVCGLSCPGPIVQVSKRLQEMAHGEILEVTATDPGFLRDIESWCLNTGNTLLEKSSEKGLFSAKILRGIVASNSDVPAAVQGGQREKTMIIFDGDLDKAIASFIIATGAAAMGNKVHMFFTFWGLSILRKKPKMQPKKDFISRMFGMMLPKNSKKLSLSKMNFGGIGAKMIRSVMKKKGVASLEELIAEAQSMGVEMTACQMSMDVMGITHDELIDGVNIGGVATMLSSSDNSNMNLFI